MKAKLNRDILITVVTNLNEDDEPNEEDEFFKAGEEIDFDFYSYPERIVNGEMVEDKNMMNVQFADGSMAFGLNKDWFDGLPDNLED